MNEEKENFKIKNKINTLVVKITLTIATLKTASDETIVLKSDSVMSLIWGEKEKHSFLKS